MTNTLTDPQSKTPTYPYNTRSTRTNVNDPQNGSTNPTTCTRDAHNRQNNITHPTTAAVPVWTDRGLHLRSARKPQNEDRPHSQSHHLYLRLHGPAEVEGLQRFHRGRLRLRQ